MIKEIKVTIYGNVQGVGMRNFVSRTAEDLGVMGYVQNREDGTVEVVAQSDGDTLEEFVEHLSEGSAVARVKDMDVVWSDDRARIYKEFQIKF